MQIDVIFYSKNCISKQKIGWCTNLSLCLLFISLFIHFNWFLHQFVFIVLYRQALSFHIVLWFSVLSSSFKSSHTNLKMSDSGIDLNYDRFYICCRNCRKEIASLTSATMQTASKHVVRFDALIEVSWVKPLKWIVWNCDCV